MKFQKTDTVFAKGLAILFLLYHHLFTNEFAQFSKICVCIFLFCSGFGIAKSLGKREAINVVEMELNDYLKYSFKYLRRIFLTYWTIFVIFFLIGNLTGLRTYSMVYSNLIQFMADIFGIGYFLFGFNHLYNITWWYMSLLIIIGIIAPILYYFINKNNKFTILFLLIFIYLGKITILNNNAIFVEYYFSVFLGLIFAKYLLFDDILKFKYQKTFSMVILIVMIFARIYFDYKVDPLLTVSICLVIISFELSKKKSLKLVNFFGNYSLEIFLIHTFIYIYFMENIIYFTSNDVIIYLSLVGISSLLAIIIRNLTESLKNIIRI